MKVIVTGGAGFIGSHLVDGLCKQGVEVVVVDDLSNGKLGNLEDASALPVRKLKVESEEAFGLVREFKPDTIFHLAALGSVPFSVAHPDRTYKANVDGTANMLDAARQVGARFVFASSASYYGNEGVVGEFGPVPKVESLPPMPLNHYGTSKVFGEMWGQAFYRMHGLEFVTLRFFNVFGPRQRPDSQYAAVVPKFIDQALKGIPLKLHGGGIQTRDMTYVDNVVGACSAVMQAPADKVAGQAFNVCGGDRVSILDLAIEIARLCTKGDYVQDTHPPTFEDIEFELVEPRPGDIRDSFGNHTKLTKATNWAPEMDWHEGVKRTVHWYQKRL